MLRAFPTRVMFLLIVGGGVIHLSPWAVGLIVGGYSLCSEFDDWIVRRARKQTSELISEAIDDETYWLDPAWLQAKLAATDVTALTADFDYRPNDEDLELVHGEIRFSSNVIAKDAEQFASQMVGRRESDARGRGADGALEGPGRDHSRDESERRDGRGR